MSNFVYALRHDKKAVWDVSIFLGALGMLLFAAYQGFAARNSPSLEETVRYIMNPDAKAATTSETTAKQAGKELEAKIIEQAVAKVEAESAEAAIVERIVEAATVPPPAFAPPPQDGDDYVASNLILQALNDHREEVHRMEERIIASATANAAERTAANSKIEAAVLGIAAKMDLLNERLLFLLGALGLVGADKIPGLKRYFQGTDRRLPPKEKE